MTAPRKILKVQKNTRVKPPANKPRCKRHDLIMVFSLNDLRWECPDPKCSMVAHPAHEEGVPIMGKGTPTLVAYRDKAGGTPRLFLRYENNVMAPLQNVALNYETQYEPFNGMNSLRSGGMTVDVQLRFNGITVYDDGERE